MANLLVVLYYLGGGDYMPKVSGSHLIVESLKKEGIKNLFILAGDHILPVLDVMEDFDFKFYDTRHEQSAVHMADAWNRITGQPGVSMVQHQGMLMLFLD